MDIYDLQAEAEELAVDDVEWYESENGSRLVGIDWIAGDIYIIDPDSPDYPQIEIAQFDGIDQLFKPKEK